jgi:hypothetical protein
LHLSEKKSQYYSNHFLEKKSKEIKDRILNLQFAKNCSNVKKLVCHIEHLCGFGCQLHFLIVCFLQAYYQNRTVILIEPKLNIFSDTYLQFSNCDYNSNEKAVNISGGKNTHKLNLR